MNKGMLTVGIILLSIIALVFVNFLSSMSTGSELDYYLLKETVDAAMTDSIDYNYYSEKGIHRIDKDRFIQNFLYRFNSTVDKSRNYKISFYEINPEPPRVAVKVDSVSPVTVNGEQGSITTSYDAILETNYRSNPLVEKMIFDRQELETLNQESTK